MSETELLSDTYKEADDGPVKRKSLKERLHHARKNCSSSTDFVRRFYTTILGSVEFVVLITFLLPVPIAMIVVGSITLNDCPAQQFIPIWLIVSGSVALVMQIMYIGKAIRLLSLQDYHVHKNELNKTCCSIHLLLFLFHFAWFIAGNIWVFPTSSPNTTDRSHHNYCNGSAYFFSFSAIVMYYIWIVVVCLSTLFAALCGPIP